MENWCYLIVMKCSYLTKISLSFAFIATNTPTARMLERNSNYGRSPIFTKKSLRVVRTYIQWGQITADKCQYYPHFIDDEASLVAQLVKKPPAMQETPVWLLGQEDSPGEGIGYSLQYSWTSLVTQLVKNLPAMQETWVLSLGWEEPLEEGKATHSSIPAWRTAWTSLYSPQGHKEWDMTEWLSLSLIDENQRQRNTWFVKVTKISERQNSLRWRSK